MTQMVLDRWAERAGSERRPAIFYEDEVISYKELLGIVNRIGNALRRKGISRGDRVLIYMPNHPLFVALNLAVIKIGAVAVPVSTLFRPRELEYILRTSEAKLAISTPQLIPNIEEARSGSQRLKEVVSVIERHSAYESIEELAEGEEELRPYDSGKDEIAFILYTSGTTGFPKGVLHAHRWLIALGHPNAVLVMGIRGGHRIMSPSEATWVWPYGYCIWYAMYMGAATAIYPGRFDPEKTFRYIEKYGVTHFVGNPTIYRRLLAVEGQRTGSIPPASSPASALARHSHPRYSGSGSAGLDARSTMYGSRRRCRPSAARGPATLSPARWEGRFPGSP